MKINLSHGNGGWETSKLINEIFMKHFRNDVGTNDEDASVLDLRGRTAFTTDSFVVKPIFFNGGDIGRLAVCGTVNDLLTTGAVPKYLSAGFIIEEGFDVDDLDRIARSMREAAEESGVLIVTGDTKVVEGNGGIYINTSGIAEVEGVGVSFRDARAGDALIVSGTLGDHHACIMSGRMGIQNSIRSDVAPLTSIVGGLRSGGVTLHGIRDITRGGLATCLNEVSEFCGAGVCIYEERIPVKPDVAGLCGILGLDSLYMANEGKMLIAVPCDEAGRALEIIRNDAYGKDAVILGEFSGEAEGVVMVTKIGGRRYLPPLVGETLPRIC